MEVRIITKNKHRSTFEFKNFKLLISITIVLFIIIGSQAFLSSYPTNIIINNETKFPTVDNINANQVTIGANQIQISEGDVLPLPKGEFIRFKAHQTANTREALKYSHYSLNHIMLLTQENFDNWNMKNTTLTIDYISHIKLTFDEPLLKVETTEFAYFVTYPDNSFVFVSSDDKSMLYKLTRHGDLSSIQLIGFNAQIPLLITNKK